jgi:Mrp family chromosome partitioning ATPase
VVELVHPRPVDQKLQVEFARHPLDTADCLDPQGGRPYLAELFRPIAARLVERAMASDAGPRNRLILVISPSFGEGKTFTAVNLALCLREEINRAVLLVDGDPWTRGAVRAVGMAPEVGLCDALSGDREPERLIAPTELANLTILVPGAALHGMTALLARRKPRTFFASCWRQIRSGWR